MMKNEHGQLQAKLNLNIEAEPAAAPAAQGQAPTFVEKPKIVTKEEGKLIMLIVRYRAEAMCETVWSFKETTITQTSTRKIIHEKSFDYWESRIELTVGIFIRFIAILYFLLFAKHSMTNTFPGPSSRECWPVQMCRE